MINVVDGQEELEVVFVNAPAILRPAIRHNAQHRQIVFLVEWQYPIVQQISRRDRGLGGVQLGMCHLGIGVDIGLLINPPDALQCADIERVLRPQIARVCGLNLAAGLIVVLFLLKRLHLRLSQNAAVSGNLDL